MSNQQINIRVGGGGFIEFPAAQTDKSVAIGLTHKFPQPHPKYIDFCVMLLADAILQIHEKGVPVWTGSTYAIDDKFRVSVEFTMEGHKVKYYQNGVLLYTSNATPTFPLFAATSLYHQGAVVRDVVMGKYN
jgi:hypothetical protein